MTIQNRFDIISNLSKRDCVKALQSAWGEDIREVPENLSIPHSEEDPGRTFWLGILCGVSSPKDKASKQIPGRKGFNVHEVLLGVSVGRQPSSRLMTDSRQSAPLQLSFSKCF